jgi:hypothetical protein
VGQFGVAPDEPQQVFVEHVEDESGQCHLTS